MKTEVTMLRLMISFLLVAITASAVVAGEKEALLDTNGKLVMANARYAQYFIRFRIPGEDPKEGAYISNYRDIYALWQCPQTVVALLAVQTPPAVQFESSSDIIRVDTELNIRFTLHSVCPDQSGYWRVPTSSSVIKEIVLTGSKNWGDSTFIIQKADNGFYKLAFGSADKPKDIGLQRVNDDISKLILSKEGAFRVSFERLG